VGGISEEEGGVVCNGKQCNVLRYQIHEDTVRERCVGTATTAAGGGCVGVLPAQPPIRAPGRDVQCANNITLFIGMVA
jgi:hypothetical protein